MFILPLKMMKKLYEIDQTDLFQKEWTAAYSNYLDATDKERELWEFGEFCYQYYLNLNFPDLNVYRPRDRYSEYDFAISELLDDFISFIDVKTIKPKSDFDLDYIIRSWTIKVQERQIKPYLKYSFVLVLEKRSQVVIFDHRISWYEISKLEKGPVNINGHQSFSYSIPYNEDKLQNFQKWKK